MSVDPLGYPWKDKDWCGTAPDPLREDEVMHGGGPHEWGYRDVATGEFISDAWPFFAMDTLQRISGDQYCNSRSRAIARAAILRLDAIREGRK